MLEIIPHHWRNLVNNNGAGEAKTYIYEKVNSGGGEESVWTRPQYTNAPFPHSHRNFICSPPPTNDAYGPHNRGSMFIGFWRWCMAFRNTLLLVTVHRLVYKWNNILQVGCPTEFRWEPPVTDSGPFYVLFPISNTEEGSKSGFRSVVFRLGSDDR